MQGKWMHGISHKKAAKRMTGHSHTHTYVWIAYMIGISGLSVPLLSKISLIQCRSSLVVKKWTGWEWNTRPQPAFLAELYYLSKRESSSKKRELSAQIPPAPLFHDQEH
jgi:hypothetical protein